MAHLKKQLGQQLDPKYEELMKDISDSLGIIRMEKAVA
jgi:hypothetical protein